MFLGSAIGLKGISLKKVSDPRIQIRILGSLTLSFLFWTFFRI